MARDEAGWRLQPAMNAANTIVRADKTAAQRGAKSAAREESVMQPRYRRAACVMLTWLMAATAGAGAGAAQTQPASDFYKGRTIELIVGWSAGAGYDVYARFLARHMGRHIAGAPAIVVQNMTGAGSLRSANHLYNVAAKDGTVIGMIGRGTAFDPILISTPAQFEAAKFNWLGSMNDEVSVCVAWHDSGVTRLEDLFTRELVIGGSGPSADTDQFAHLMNRVIGTKLKIIPGYPGGNDINLAMQRGEVKGRCGWSWSSIVATHGEDYRKKTFHVLVQMSLSRHKDLPDVPFIMDLAKTEEQRQIFKVVFARQVMGRPFLAPPGVPADRVAALRKAFMDTMTDKEFLAEAAKLKIEINAVSGERVQQLVEEIYAQPREIAKKAGAALN